MHDTGLDLTVRELSQGDVRVGALSSVELSYTELENIAAPGFGDFIASFGAATSFSGLVVASIALT